MTQTVKMEKRLMVKEINPFITCTLCDGYFFDATTLVECLHTFCRGCLLKNFENRLCPTCNMDYKKRTVCFKPDKQIQALVYKIVPHLYAKENQRMEDFYRSTTVRASSSCSDDSVIERERNQVVTNEEGDTHVKQIGEGKFLTSEDPISLSLEYYQHHLDVSDESANNNNNNNNKSVENGVGAYKNNGQNLNGDAVNGDQKKDGEKRFLSCPAAVSMKHLQKFVRMKYALTADHRVDIIYKGEVLPDTYSLMDVAYIFLWKRVKPMRFFYRIFTPMKVRPIKIVNTTLSTGGKQLQIVPVKPNSDVKSPVEKPAEKPPTIQDLVEEDRRPKKEELMAHLQLQSKARTVPPVETKKVEAVKSSTELKAEKVMQDCVFDYNESEEEIKKFAERRDREWAMQKKMDESRQAEDNYHHTSKKRKKNKHSKNEMVHKKRKLHAEKINTDDDLLKIKVKLTNGHKHKHHKSTDKNSNSELSQKEKLLQMRQIRKPVVEEKTVPSTTIKISKNVVEKPTPVPNEKETEEKKVEKVKVPTPPPAPEAPKLRTELKVELSRVTEAKPVVTKVVKPPVVTKPAVNNVWNQQQQKKPLTQTESEKQKQTFLKNFQSFTERYNKSNQEKVVQGQKEAAKVPKPNLITNNKSLDQKLANLQQRCTIEPKMSQPIQSPKQQEKVNFEKPVLTTGYPAGFTVSKIESGVKRKSEDEKEMQDKRPSLEITLIPPTPPTTPVVSTSPTTPKPADKPQAKRPPPATIPLDRIKKSVGLKSGLSIIPKMPEKCDNIGALDLTKHKIEQSKPETPNGTKQPSPGPARPDAKNSMQLSNLQMLSKVATEQNTFSKPVVTPGQPKIRQQMPNLQTLKIPSMTTNSMIKPATIQRMPPKLNEIKFRPQQTQMRNFRPNQNQNIRNIPNPSLLIKQNQNRMNSFNSQQQAQDKAAEKSVNQKETNSAINRPSPVVETTKVTEKTEISV